jgi:CHAD domain-containing protein
MTRTRTAGVKSMTARAYAQQQTRTLLRRLAYQVNQTLRLGDADSVHDLRVAIRRFTQCLRTFAQFFPKAETRKIRHKLKAVMQAASDVRDYDIALDLFKDAGIPRKSKAGAAVDKLRKQAEKKLMDAIRLSSRDNFSRKWRTKLEL